MKINKRLKYLDLDWNQNIKRTGGIALGEALKKNKTLESLSILYNYKDRGLEREGVMAIISALKVNKSLKRVWTAAKGLLEPEDFLILGNALRKNTMLDEFHFVSYFNRNDIDTRHENFISEAYLLSSAPFAIFDYNRLGSHITFYQLLPVFYSALNKDEERVYQRLVKHCVNDGKSKILLKQVEAYRKARLLLLWEKKKKSFNALPKVWIVLILKFLLVNF